MFSIINKQHATSVMRQAAAYPSSTQHAVCNTEGGGGRGGGRGRGVAMKRIMERATCLPLLSCYITGFAHELFPGGLHQIQCCLVCIVKPEDKTKQALTQNDCVAIVDASGSVPGYQTSKSSRMRYRLQEGWILMGQCAATKRHG